MAAAAGAVGGPAPPPNGSRGGGPHSLPASASSDPDYQFKLILIGDAKVGKSCFLHYFVARRFKQASKTTLGVEFGSQVIDISGKLTNLRVWDTAGDERFRSITRSYYRNAVGVLIFYDITSRASFLHVPQWIEDARKYAQNNCVLMLVGNKSDLADGEHEDLSGDGGGSSSSVGSDDDGSDGGGERGDKDGVPGSPSRMRTRKTRREVPMLEASAFAQERNMLFLETSALTGNNVMSAFLRCARRIVSKVEAGELTDGLMRKGLERGWEQQGVEKASGGCAC